MIAIPATLALATALVFPPLACNQSLPSQLQAAPSAAASLVLKQAQQLQTQQLVPETHFAGPTWRDCADGSAVVGRVLKNFLAPFSFDGQLAIPWLLLEAAFTTSAANEATGTFTPTTFVQRLFTAGGVVPTSDCDVSTDGRARGVPYAFSYEFFMHRSLESTFSPPEAAISTSCNPVTKISTWAEHTCIINSNVVLLDGEIVSDR